MGFLSNFFDEEVFKNLSYLFGIALILLSTKVLGLFSRKLQMPQVVGALVAGILLGPLFTIAFGGTGITLFSNSDMTMISKLSEIGVIVLMFSAGLETDIHEMKNCGFPAFIIALLGVVVPLLGGGVVAYFFVGNEMRILKAIFVGVVLTATSVSITVETLKEMGKLNSRAGNAILAAAVIDDILGIIALTIITSFADANVNIWIVLLKIFLFFVFSIVCGIIMYFIFKWLTAKHNRDARRYVIISFAYCLIMALCAEVFFGVADITGAYIAGVVLSLTNKREYLENRFGILSYMFISPIFFAYVGLQISGDALVKSMSGSLLLFAGILTVVAIITKLIGCGVGAKVCGYKNRECLQIGAGMISRGEVALIVANKGVSCGLMDSTLSAPLIIVVVITTVIAPVILKLMFKEKNNDSKSLAS
ncbi:MAG: cation:proton antiporter [Acutalibacteraceae bacterium]